MSPVHLKWSIPANSMQVASVWIYGHHSSEIKRYGQVNPVFGGWITMS